MRLLIIWMVISIGLFLCPGPSFWYGLLQAVGGAEESIWSLLAVKVQVFLVHVEENKEIKQLSAHFMLMAICSHFLCVTCKGRLPNISWQVTVGCVVGFIFIFSLAIEVVQSLLPASFSRGFAWVDILFSIFGALMGLGIHYLQRCIKKDEAAIGRM